MSKYHYEVPADSATGKKISHFWQKCIRCEQAADDYAKKMGATYYYSDPRYFAGGVVCIAFADGQRIDKKVWRVAGTDRADGKTYYEPDCQRRTGLEPIPNRDYQMRDTFDRIYNRDGIVEREMADETTGEKTMQLFMPYVEFYRDEQSGTRNDLNGKQPCKASRGLRKAVKAEVQRLKLPVMKVDALLSILGAAIEGKAVETTPAFFFYRERYFIGIDYDCSSNPDLILIAPELYKMNRDRAELDAKRGWS
jgi:hypothetical protein